MNHDMDDASTETHRDLTLSERVAEATTWEDAVRTEDGAFYVELSVYPIESESPLPRASFDLGPFGMLKRLVQRRPVQGGRTVPRRRS
jgi:hypothetical protein